MDYINYHSRYYIGKHRGDYLHTLGPTVGIFIDLKPQGKHMARLKLNWLHWRRTGSPCIGCLNFG